MHQKPLSGRAPSGHNEGAYSACPDGPQAIFREGLDRQELRREVKEKGKKRELGVKRREKERKERNGWD